jgi:uncharacterized protein (TIGR03067 family)
VRPPLVVLAVILLLAAAPVAPVPKAKPKRPDAEVLAGTWEAVTVGQEGQMWGTVAWTIDDKLVLKIAYPEEGGRFTTWQVKLAPDRSPKQIDVGGFKGIYELDETGVRVAYSSGARPPSLDPQPGVYSYVLRRAEPKK